MAKELIKINDFNLFYDTIKALSKMSDGIKITINDCGYVVYAKNDYSKCELTSNSLTSSNEISFCIGSISIFLKTLDSVRKIYQDDYSSVNLSYDKPFFKIESPKFKTKLATVDQERIVNFIGTKVHTEMTTAMMFKTNSDIIKNINGHSFMFSDTSNPRIYITTNPEMQNNTVFATIGNENNDLENSVTLELGLVSSGDISDKKIILDFNRLNILNMIPSDDITIEIANERPVMWSKIKRSGKNNSYFNLGVYSFMMVK